MHDVLGRADANELAQLKRAEAIVVLRVRHPSSVQALGGLFDLIRGQVRQLTPPIHGNGRTSEPGSNGEPCDLATARQDLPKVFCLAARDPSTWNGL